LAKIVATMGRKYVNFGRKERLKLVFFLKSQKVYTMGLFIKKNVSIGYTEFQAQC
jgi:hypothetical protein